MSIKMLNGGFRSLTKYKWLIVIGCILVILMVLYSILDSGKIHIDSAILEDVSILLQPESLLVLEELGFSVEGRHEDGTPLLMRRSYGDTMPVNTVYVIYQPHETLSTGDQGATWIYSAGYKRIPFSMEYVSRFAYEDHNGYIRIDDLWADFRGDAFEEMLLYLINICN